MSQTGTQTLLGQLVRQRRESLGLSANDLAARAHVRAPVVHRLEAGHRTLPTPVKLAQILTVLGIGAPEVRAVLTDERYRADVLHWMERSAAFVEVAERLRPPQSTAVLAGTPEPGMLAIKDGRMAAFWGTGVEEIRDVLRASGWRVLRDA